MVKRIYNSGTILLLSILFNISLSGQDGIKENGFVQIFYPNGQVSSEGMMRDGKPDGFWRTYYVTGVIKSEGKRTNFLLDSTWNFYNQSGELVQQIDYRLGKKSGYSLEYIYSNPENPGQPTLVSKELYVNDKKEGESYYYYNTGELWQIVYYREGQRHGITREFSKDGIQITILEYSNNYLINRERINRTDSFGKRQGTYKTFYDNGQLKMEQNFKDDQLDGSYREYAPDGTLKIAMRYELGAIIDKIDEDVREVLDIRNSYDAEGRLIFSGGYREDIPVGIHRFFDTLGNVINAYLYNEMGQKISEGIIDEEGRRVGNWKDFYETGELRANGNYLDNQRSGEWFFYFRNGAIEQKGRFARGRFEGTWTWYYPDGTIWREENYFGGREDGLFVEYDDQGNVVTKGEYLSGERNGEWIYNVGDHSEKGSYILGLREGVWQYFFIDGTLKYEGSYYQGNPDGRHKYYYPSGQLKEDQYYQMGIREKNWKKYDEEGNLIMTITYKNDQEIRINGIKVDLPERDIKLIR